MREKVVILDDTSFSYLPKTQFSLLKGQSRLCAAYGLQKIPEAWSKVTYGDKTKPNSEYCHTKPNYN